MTFPSADDFAAAIIAACSHTGEDPLDLAKREEMRARHYAYHALRAKFPTADRVSMADCLGCPGKPSYFHRSSTWWVLGDRPGGGGKNAPWWSHAVLSKVCEEIGAVTPDEIIPIPSFLPERQSSPEVPKPLAPVPTVVYQVMDEKPGRARGIKTTPWDAGRATRHDRPMTNRKEAINLLQEAVRNTQRLQNDENQQ